jgi:hypothetical protein
MSFHELAKRGVQNEFCGTRRVFSVYSASISVCMKYAMNFVDVMLTFVVSRRNAYEISTIDNLRFMNFLFSGVTKYDFFLCVCRR